MRVVLMVVAVLVGFLSVAAGAAKVARVPEEVAFLEQFGFSSVVIVLFGVVQIMGGLLLLVPRTRALGALVAGVAFSVSVVLLVADGNLGFAAVSLIPVVLSIWVGLKRAGATPAAA